MSFSRLRGMGMIECVLYGQRIDTRNHEQRSLYAKHNANKMQRNKNRLYVEN